MALTAIAIIKSPWGKRSGAHFNPAITLTFLRLGKISAYDATFYIIAQFAGAVAGVGIAALLLGHHIASPQVDYAITVPGVGGVAGAFAAETFMAALLMAIVLSHIQSPANGSVHPVLRRPPDRLLHLAFSPRSQASASIPLVVLDRPSSPESGLPYGSTSPPRSSACWPPPNDFAAWPSRTSLPDHVHTSPIATWCNETICNDS